MKKKILAVCLAILSVSVLAFVGCVSSQKYEKLSSKFSEAKVKSSAEEVVTNINAAKFEAVCGNMSETLKGSLPAEALQKAVSPFLSKAGAFDSFSSETVSGLLDTKSGQEYATAVVMAKYKNQTVQYTITFDTDMKMAGIYFK
ncbi:MAG TPA: DUF3887 domain-containing protein [Clostridia bacterium]|nr:DUF3887 domain-containing protein [Clostridia bacterium]